MTERRKHKRYPIAYPVEHEEERDKKPLTLVDVSENGVAFTSREEVRVKDLVHINIFLKKRMFTLKAEVVHALPSKKDNYYNIGARFVNVPEDFRKILNQEVDDITQFCREANIYQNQDLSLRKASEKYLKNFPIS
ncbi:MAG: PilZ domain-containing protein [Candidatus Omnitrophota bacterium]